MAVEKISVVRFLQMSENYPVFDVRSPSEYSHAHIPGAYNLPLFSDEERKIIGTTYKQQSREAAIKIGLDFFGPKMKRMVDEVEKICANHRLKDEGNMVLVHCWRGGMRSAAVAWLMDLYGFKVYTLPGGYKKFRTLVLQLFSLPYRFNILGGYTGSGKTVLLHHLQRYGYPVIDLEALAHHKGSAFGAIQEPPQPSQEMFENKLAKALFTGFRLETALTSTEPMQEIFSKDEQGDYLSVWLEDESQRIGNVNIPNELWMRMRNSPVFFLDIPFEERLMNLVCGYGELDKEKMINAIVRIKKRLGGLETKNAVNYLIEDNVRESFRVLLHYYDKHYQKGLFNRQKPEDLVRTISCERVEEKNVLKVIKAATSANENQLIEE